MSQQVLDKSRIPAHVAIIMDGNGRWAAKRHLVKKMGHKAGADALETVSRAAMDLGIKHLTVYAFSTENWKRSDEEVSGIMDLLRQYLKNFMTRATKDNVRVDVIGERSRLDEDIQQQIADLEANTKTKTGMALHIALNYGGRDELLRATKKIAEQVASGSLLPNEITEQIIENALDTAGIPDPDLLIRTSGEERISNFLLWQIAYSEMVVTKKLWPDFGPKDLEEALLLYQSRDRRFGGR